MSEWKKCRLDQIGRIVTGKTPKTSCPEYWDGEVPFVTPGDLQLSKHLLSTVRSVSLKGAESVKGAILPSGSICVSCIGVIGYVSMTTQVSVSNQQVNSIIVNDDFDADFVYYVLRNNWWAFKNMEGFSSVVSILNKSSFSELAFEFPDLPTQRRIAAVLGALDDKIENNRKICENLEAQAQALFKSWFVDFEPWGGKMPEGWKKGKLGDIADITMGQSPDGKSLNENDNGVTFFQGRAEFGSRYPTKRLSTTEPKRMARVGDVLVSVRAPVGDLNIALEDCCIGRGLASVRSKSGCQSFVFALLRSLKPAFDLYEGAGTIFGSINKDGMHELLVVVPRPEVMMRYEEIVAPMDAMYLEREKESRALAEMRDALLPQLMSGRLRVDATACQGEIDVGKVEI